METILFRRFGVHLVWILSVALMAGCGAYSPQALTPGSTIEQTTKHMGRATGDYSLTPDGRRLEYARGPGGLHTYMVDFDAQGRLVGWNQVLTPDVFGSIAKGSTRDDVLRTLGHPGKEFAVWSGHQTIWAYSFESMSCEWFLVGIDPSGKVSSTSYGPDPRCEAGDKGDRN
jgi:hypothetical protein